MSSKKGKGRKAKQQAAADASKRRASERLDVGMFSRFQPYVETMYDPENGSGALFPSEHTHMGASRRKPIIITYTSQEDDETVVFKMYPRLENTIVQSTGGTVPAPDSTNQVFFVFEGTVPADTVVGLLGRAPVASSGRGGPESELPLTTAALGGRSSLGVEISTPAGGNLPFMVVSGCDFGFRINPYYRDAVTGVWTATTTNAIPANSTVGFTTGTIANGISGFGFNIHNTSASPRALRFSVVVNGFNSNSVAPVVLTYPASASQSISALTDAQALDEFRTVAMSLRLTCMGDLTTTAGQVACALVPREFVPDPDDVVGSIAQLPTGAYDGKLIDGCDVIWQPRIAVDYDYQPPESDKGAYYIIVAARLAKANTPIRIKASYNYEVFSLDPALGMMQYCPSAFGLQEVLQAVFSAVPPGSSNDGHVSKFRRALAALRSVVKKPIEWVIEHPAEVATMAKAAAALLVV